MTTPVNGFIKKTSMPAASVAEASGHLSPPPIDVEIEEADIDLNHVAYYRNNSNYDLLLSALLNKVRGMRGYLSNKK